MTAARSSQLLPDREAIVHALYEAAELEHNLMCTYLYAAFSLRDGVAEGLTPETAGLVAGWRRTLIEIAVEEMRHLVAVWNITSALGASPRVGRTNFPIDPGHLPAGVVVRLAPFNADTLQHFIFLERPAGSDERDGATFVTPKTYQRGGMLPRLVPMGLDYATVGVFYATIAQGLRSLAASRGEPAVFAGDPALQFRGSGAFTMPRVICLKTALGAFDAIVSEGEGAPRDITGSHFQRFLGIRDEYSAVLRRDPEFEPAFPAATNPVQRRPPSPEGRVWIENPEASAVVDLANASYALMLRLLAYGYSIPGSSDEKPLVESLATGLMHAIVPLAEKAARLPAGPSNPGCNAGMSFAVPRDSAAFPPSRGAREFFAERLEQLAAIGATLGTDGDRRLADAAGWLQSLAERARRDLRSFTSAMPGSPAAAGLAAAGSSVASDAQDGSLAPQSSTTAAGVEVVGGRNLEITFEARRCIHARFCVTGGPRVFLANVEGPWIHPDAMDVERVVEIAHACPSGAIRYRRPDGSGEAAPPVNLVSVRERGPYAFRGPLRLAGQAIGYRATLCRCGASKHKPYCDGSHKEIGFDASGEPESTTTDMLDIRDGNVSIEPERNGPLEVRGSIEIISGTGRVVARTKAARLCRCGRSATKPFCDGTHARIGFRSD